MLNVLTVVNKYNMYLSFDFTAMENKRLQRSSVQENDVPTRSCMHYKMALNKYDSADLVVAYLAICSSKIATWGVGQPIVHI